MDHLPTMKTTWAFRWFGVPCHLPPGGVGWPTTTAILLMCTAVFAEPVKVCPANPHYLMFKGKPVVLITSDHHYGAVMDRDFDFSNYLNYLGSQRMNLTRIYPGGMFEPPDKWLRGNPLGPAQADRFCPGRGPPRPGRIQPR